MSFAQINGQNIYFEDAGGKGQPVIFGHGFLMDHEMFAPQVAALAPEFRVITWDERGFGLTEFDGKPFSYWDSAKDCLGLLDHLGIKRAVVGGMSQGGYLSLRVALTEPDRVQALVLIDTQAAGEEPEKKAGYQQMLDMWASLGPVDQLAQTIAQIIIDQPGENERWIAKWKARPHQGIVEPGRCLLERDDISARMREIKCPALVIHGSNDNAIPMAKAKAMSEGLSGSQGVVEIAGAGHASNLTHPQPVNTALLPFLRSVGKNA